MTLTTAPPPLRSAEIIAVGSELLTPFRSDTNSLYLTARLNELGIAVRTKVIVGDRRDDLAIMLRQALERVDLVVLTGGLGPTDDDVTREVVAAVLQLPLEEHAPTIDAIRARFEGRGLTMPEINRRQAMVPVNGIPLDNLSGTAPGLWIDQGDRVIVLLPGPPQELQPMVERHVRSRLERRTAASRLVRRVLRITGRPESYVDELAQPVYEAWKVEDPPIDTTVLAALGQIELHLTTTASRAGGAEDRLNTAVRALCDVLGPDVFSTDGRTLEETVGALLKAQGLRIAVAESCTGGLVTSRLTDVPGASTYVERGVVVYSNEAKHELLAVPEALLREHGAVSEAVARAMTDGIVAAARVNVGVGVTGVAGPGGGTSHKPVGTVAIAATVGDEHRIRMFQFPGTREQIKVQASQAALDMVRRMLQRST